MANSCAAVRLADNNKHGEQTLNSTFLRNPASLRYYGAGSGFSLWRLNLPALVRGRLPHTGPKLWPTQNQHTYGPPCAFNIQTRRQPISCSARQILVLDVTPCDTIYNSMPLQDKRTSPKWRRRQFYDSKSRCAASSKTSGLDRLG